jgi:hypothetical protein
MSDRNAELVVKLAKALAMPAALSFGAYLLSNGIAQHGKEVAGGLQNLACAETSGVMGS